MDEILDEFNRTSDPESNVRLLMKMSVVEGLCPEIKTGFSGTKFDSELTEEWHQLEHDLGQPCTDLLSDCKLNNVDIDCRKIFKPFSADLGQCCAFNLLPAVLNWEIQKTEDEGRSITS